MSYKDKTKQKLYLQKWRETIQQNINSRTSGALKGKNKSMKRGNNDKRVNKLIQELEAMVDTTAGSSGNSKEIMEIEDIVWEKQLPMNEKEKSMFLNIDQLNEMEVSLTNTIE